MAGFVASPGMGGGGGAGLPGLSAITGGLFGGGGNYDTGGFLAGQIIDGIITDPVALQKMLTFNPDVIPALEKATQQIIGSSSFNPSQLPTWLKVLAPMIPSIAGMLAAVTRGSSSNPVTSGQPSPSASPSTTPGTPTGTPTGLNTPLATPTQASDIAGRQFSSSAILPGVIPPINPSLQTAWNNFLTQNVGTGVPQYPGKINAPINKNLTQTWQQFQPDVTKTPGGSAMSAALPHLFNPTTNPILAQMMMTGSPSGPSPLAGLAAGQLGGPAQFLAPFLMNNVPGAYAAPNIPIRSVSIGGGQ